MQDLYHRLLRDMESIHIPTDFTLELKGFSKTYFGRYDPNLNKVTVYVCENKSCTKRYKYEDILMTCIHEAIHAMQWHDESFVRRRGVMHNADFYRLYSMYSDRAKSLLLLREVKHDRAYQTHRGKAPEVHCRPHM